MTDASASEPPAVDEIPQSVIFGDQLDWSSPVVDVALLVELPFWLMMDSDEVHLPYQGAVIRIRLRDDYSQLFAGQVRDSGRTIVYQGPEAELQRLPADVVEYIEQEGALDRPCRSMLRFASRAHSDVFDALVHESDENAPQRRANEARTYLASLCDAHIPVINELVQRYRLATYDHFAYEVTPWDVPLWMVKSGPAGSMVRLMDYAGWDRRPVTDDQDTTGDPKAGATPFRFTDLNTLLEVSLHDATPGEFDLLDARSFMERGDYTGAVRRSVTAIEAVVEAALREELLKRYPPAEVDGKLEASEKDYPGRYRQWKKLSGVIVGQEVEDAFEDTRKTRHNIVHRAHRLTHTDRGAGQKSVDTARWLFNRIEGKPQRELLREHGTVLRSLGRTALAPRFAVASDASGIRVLEPSRPNNLHHS